MGLIKAALGGVGGMLADQWKEYFYCDALPADVLVSKGQKRVSGRSSNTKAEDNIISNGSVIAVNNGQCMIVVDQGKVVELSAEPGEYTYDKSSEPTIFEGSLGKSILSVFSAMGRRITFGGDTGKDQRVYFFNIKEIMDNKFGTPSPIPFRVVDSRIGLDVDVNVRCNGVYSYRIENPILFYTNVCGNISGNFTRSNIESQLKAEFISALQPAFGKLSALEMRPNQLMAHTVEMEQAMNEVLNAKWIEGRGIRVLNVSLSSVTLPEEDQAMIKEAQKKAIYRDPSMAAANLVDAQAEAMKTAAGNAAGAMHGFVGLNMSQNAGGLNAERLFAMGQQNQPQSQPKPAAGDTWTCACGNKGTGKFCTSCGAKRPEAPESWTCTCGKVNTGKFCPECGSPRPAKVKRYRCSNCGWQPEDPTKPPKFCPECGNVFGDEDVIG